MAAWHGFFNPHSQTSLRRLSRCPRSQADPISGVWHGAGTTVLEHRAVSLPRSIIAIVIVGAALLSSQGACGQETIMITEDSAMMAAEGMGTGSCGCDDVRRPPWHGNVRGSCNPCCDPHTGVFHANPCGQLDMQRYAREHCMRMPSHFPRLHILSRDGYLLSPTPPAIPRCHQCGAVIDGAF
jgi:hypothetical protein